MKTGKVTVLAVVVVLLTAVGYGLGAWLMGWHSSSAGDAETAQTTQLEKTLAELSANPPSSEEGYAVGDRLAVDSPRQSMKLDPAYPELDWDKLMPDDWDPMAAFRDLNVAELQDNDPKAQEALNKMRAAWSDAPVNASLAGQKVRIPGFVIPIEQSESGVDELLLVPYFGACIHTPPPPANQIIHVKLSEAEPAVGAMQAYWVWGELTTSKFSSELGDAAYHLKATGIQPYDK